MQTFQKIDPLVMTGVGHKVRSNSGRGSTLSKASRASQGVQYLKYF